MSKIIGFIGKGGTGKSTLTTLFLKYLVENNIAPVLVIDADPNNCLGDLLSLDVESTIGNIRRELLEKKSDFHKTAVSKYDYCEYALNNALIESTQFDLITMGKPDGPGCYCYVNNIVKITIEKLKKNYKFIVIDCEAGLEHLSRKTISGLNIAFIVSDLSRKGIITGKRQVQIMKELGINTDNNYLLINNILNNDISTFDNIITGKDNNNYKYAGTIRNDKNIQKFELERKSLLDLPGNSESYQDLKTIINKARIFHE